MSKSTSTGYTDTAIAGYTPQTLTMGAVNFGANFTVKSEIGGKELVITNLTCPVDRPEKFRYSFTDVANVYTGTGIEPSLAAPSKKGISLLVQLTEVLSVTESTDADFRIDLPVSYHLVVKVPSSEYITASVVQTGICRLLSGLYATGDDATTRIDALLRGSLKPSDI